MLALMPYLGGGLALIVALIAFKRAANLYQDARVLLFEVQSTQRWLDQGKLHDEIAELSNAVQANRDLIARIQGRQGGRPPKTVAAESPADTKQRLRSQLMHNGVSKHGNQ